VTAKQAAKQQRAGATAAREREANARVFRQFTITDISKTTRLDVRSVLHVSTFLQSCSV